MSTTAPLPSPRPTASITPAGSASTVATVRVLVVEDEADLADAIARGLRREGYAVDVAYDGDAALDKLGVNAYDVVCLDVNLPGTDGMEVVRRMRSARGPEP